MAGVRFGVFTPQGWKTELVGIPEPDTFWDAYDTRTDTLTFQLRDGVVSTSDEVSKGVVLDFDDQGTILGIEVLDASKRSINPKALEFAVS